MRKSSSFATLINDFNERLVLSRLDISLPRPATSERQRLRLGAGARNTRRDRLCGASHTEYCYGVAIPLEDARILW